MHAESIHANRRFQKECVPFLNLLLAQGELTSFHPKVTCSPSESPDPEKSSVKTVIFDGRRIIAASLASALHPLENK
jgi:hypothetical protein